MIVKEHKLNKNVFDLADILVNTIINLPNTTISERKLGAEIQKERNYQALLNIFASAKRKNKTNKIHSFAGEKIAPLSLIAARMADECSEMTKSQKNELVNHFSHYSESSLDRCSEFLTSVLSEIKTKKSKIELIRAQMKKMGVTNEILIQSTKINHKTKCTY